jgi:hypothetical protein
MDCADPRGFTVFDTETREFKFIRNPFTMFKKVYYADGCDQDLTELKDKFVKLIVEKKTDLYKFDSFLNNLRNAEVYDLGIVENTDHLNLMGGDVDERIEVEDTAKIIENYVDGLETSIDKEKIKAYLQSLYVESIAL